jgi:subfamily B ATP-binding cassette protein MsbA
MKFKTLFFFNIRIKCIVFALVTMFIISTKLTLFVLFLCLFPDGSFQKLLKFESTIIKAQRESGFLISIVDETLGG